MNLSDKRNQEYQELKERRAKEEQELHELLKIALSTESIELLSIKEDKENLSFIVSLAFTLDGYRQEDIFYWKSNESQEEFILSVKNMIDYIKELRSQYPEFCHQNDYIQTNSKFQKTITLTHTGYEYKFTFNIELADYLKLPNTTSCSCGGGDYQIKRTPVRVEEFNKNIDITIDVLLDCISELKQKKYTLIKTLKESV